MRLSDLNKQVSKLKMGQSLRRYRLDTQWMEELALTLAIICLTSLVLFLAFLFGLAYLAFWGIQMYLDSDSPDSDRADGICITC